MLRFFFLAVTAVLLVSAGYILLPRHTTRPDTHLDTPPPAAATDPTTFTVHEAPPPPPALPPPTVPAAAPPPSQPAPNGLDAVMQRLRAAAAQHPEAAQPDSQPPPAAISQAPPVITPVSPPPVPPPVAPTVISPAPPASRWTNVTPQGARWRLTPAQDGFVIAIDLGGSRVASVHVATAFANLDPASMNQRVDYLRQTILQNFPPESASYTFARDGSVSLDH